MKPFLVAGAVVAVGVGGLYAVYRYQQASKKDPGQQKQAAAPMPAQANPAGFQSPQLAYAPGASPTLTQIGQGLQVAQGAIATAKALGFFSGDSTDAGDDDAA